jgi:hypothetical protein
MFRNVIYETWLNWVPYVAFGVTSAVFITFSLRAITLRKDQAEHLARLPFDD